MSDDLDLDLAPDQEGESAPLPEEPTAVTAEESAVATAEEERFSPMPPPDIPPAKGHKKLGRIIAIVLAAVVLIGAAAAFAVPAIIKAVNPKAAVLAALSKTLDNAGFGDAGAVAASLQKGAFEQSFSLRLGEEMPEDLRDSLSRALTIAPDRLSGTGFSLFLQMDKAQRKAAVSYGLDLGLYHAGDLQLFMDDNILSLGSPELTNRKFYWMDTETLGADWHANDFWSQVEGVPQDLSFNVFDMAESAAGKDSIEALAALNEASTMAKDGDGAYTLTVPADALRTYLNTTLTAQMSDVDDFVDLFTDGATATFIVTGGAVTRMEIILPMTADGERLFLRFVMEQNENGVLFFTLTGEDEDGEVEVSLTASPSVYTDKAAKQVSVELPDISLTADGERLSLGVSFTMEPMGEFAFQPDSPISLMELDQNGVLELLFGALGGLEKIAQEMSTGY